MKPVGRPFSLTGHRAHRDVIMLPIEIVSARDPFLLRARETINIVKFKTEKRQGVLEYRAWPQPVPGPVINQGLKTTYMYYFYHQEVIHNLVTLGSSGWPGRYQLAIWQP